VTRYDGREGVIKYRGRFSIWEGDLGSEKRKINWQRVEEGEACHVTRVEKADLLR